MLTYTTLTLELGTRNTIRKFDLKIAKLNNVQMILTQQNLGGGWQSANELSCFCIKQSVTPLCHSFDSLIEPVRISVYGRERDYSIRILVFCLSKGVLWSGCWGCLPIISGLARSCCRYSGFIGGSWGMLGRRFLSVSTCLLGGNLSLSWGMGPPTTGCLLNKLGSDSLVMSS